MVASGRQQEQRVDRVIARRAGSDSPRCRRRVRRAPAESRPFVAAPHKLYPQRFTGYARRRRGSRRAHKIITTGAGRLRYLSVYLKWRDAREQPWLNAPPGPHARAGWYLRRPHTASQPERAARGLGVRRKTARPVREVGSRPGIATGASPIRPRFGCAPDIADSAGERESACGARLRACSAGTAQPDRGIASSTRELRLTAVTADPRDLSSNGVVPRRHDPSSRAQPARSQQPEGRCQSSTGSRSSRRSRRSAAGCPKRSRPLLNVMSRTNRDP